MTRLVGLLARLARDLRGAVAVEFGILAPILILMLFGVLEIGIIMQNYNAVRALAADGSRFATVQYQTGVNSPAASISTWIRSRATSGLYNLNTDKLTVNVTPATTSSLNGLREYDVSVSYAADEYLWTIAGNTLTVSANKKVWVYVKTTGST